MDLRDDLQKIGLGFVIYALVVAGVVGAGLAIGLAWRAFTWAAGVGG